MPHEILLFVEVLLFFFNVMSRRQKKKKVTSPSFPSLIGNLAGYPHMLFSYNQEAVCLHTDFSFEGCGCGQEAENRCILLQRTRYQCMYEQEHDQDKKKTAQMC